MKIWLRTLFAVLAVLAIATQAARSTSKSPAPAPDLAARLVALGLRPAEPRDAGALTATIPGCAERLTFAQVDFDGSGRDQANALLAGPAIARFAYLGFVGGRADTAAMLARWAAATALQAIGLRRQAVPREMVLAVLPSSCPQLTRMDWSRLSPWS